MVISNNMGKSLIVQKYGGSSVANTDRIKNVANRIGRYKKKGYSVAVVVSALEKTLVGVLDSDGATGARGLPTLAPWSLAVYHTQNALIKWGQGGLPPWVASPTGEERGSP